MRCSPQEARAAARLRRALSRGSTASAQHTSGPAPLIGRHFAQGRWEPLNARAPRLQVLWPAILAHDLPSLGTDFEMPVYLFQGAGDLVTDTDVVHEYYERIHAPVKEPVLFRSQGHMAVFNARARFLQELVKHLRPDQAVGAAPGP